jgi:predicted ferric reductase
MVSIRLLLESIELAEVEQMRSPALKFVYLAIYALAPVALILVLYRSNPAYYGTSGLVPMVLGATAYSFLNFQLILSARPKWAEKHFGLDRFYQFHAIMALVAITLVIIHRFLKLAAFPPSLKTSLGQTAAIIILTGVLLALVFMAETLAGRIKAIRRLRQRALRWLPARYHVQRMLHNVNVLAVVVIFIHVQLSSSARGLAVRLLYIAYFAIALGFYAYHKILRRWLADRRFTIRRVIRESESLTTLEMTPESGPAFHYLPGQFGFLCVLDPAVSPEKHPFSFTSQPGDPQLLSFTIKNLGDWTARVHAVQAGSKVWVDGPYGRFSPLLRDSSGGIVLIAGGIGITPVLSILRYFRQFGKDGQVLLVWGANQKSDLIAADEFQAFQREMPGLTVVPVLANEPGWEGEKGFITQKILEGSLAKAGMEPANAHFYFCGPAPMWQPIRMSLQAMHIKKGMIHYEKFAL